MSPFYRSPVALYILVSSLALSNDIHTSTAQLANQASRTPENTCRTSAGAVCNPQGLRPTEAVSPPFVLHPSARHISSALLGASRATSLQRHFMNSIVAIFGKCVALLAMLFCCVDSSFPTTQHRLTTPMNGIGLDKSMIFSSSRFLLLLFVLRTLSKSVSNCGCVLAYAAFPGFSAVSMCQTT